ncbi:hypothetical protein GGR54DRAFT_395192 [Hypoxylon sp. NC1633]|nr:hypothetical protein GGR54DRAFT_395192 [Hypoxylon sp. NC1633]
MVRRPSHFFMTLSHALSVAAAVGYGHDIATPYKRAELLAACADISAPTTFSLKSIQYVKYVTYPGAYDVPPNSTQLAFDVINQANEVSTNCFLENVGFGNTWGDDSNYWYGCTDQSLDVGGEEYPVRTNAHIVWNEWRLVVNQTWACDQETTVMHIAAATLTPSCTEYNSPFQYTEGCSAPDTDVAAVVQ